MSAYVRYQRNEAEQLAHKELLENLNEEDSEEEKLKEDELDDVRAEYIFLIDRSGSMY